VGRNKWGLENFLKINSGWDNWEGWKNRDYLYLKNLLSYAKKYEEENREQSSFDLINPRRPWGRVIIRYSRTV